MALKQNDFVAWVDSTGKESVKSDMRGFVLADYDTGICIIPLAGGYDSYTIRSYIPDEFRHLLDIKHKYNNWGHSPGGRSSFLPAKMTAEDQRLATSLGLEFKVPKIISGSDPYSANDGSGRTSVYTNNPETTAFEFL